MKIDIIDELNEEQKEAVQTTEGYVRVIAGAGSGKTKALTNRYIYLVNTLGISTANILCVTFTNKAAREMKKRIRQKIGDNDTGLICTFHGFCRSLLKEDIYAINYPDNFIVMDTEDQDAILRIVYDESKISSKECTFSRAKDMISRRKSNYYEYMEYIIKIDNIELKNIYEKSKSSSDKIFWGYLYHQKKNYNLDFDDLILFSLYILENNQDIREKWQKKLQYIMVDEFQDVNGRQYSLVKILSEYNKNLFIVGDPDQTIYSWRGANVNYILKFDEEFENVKTIIMNKNYRSSKDIIDASNSLISKNIQRIDKKLEAIKLNTIPVTYNHSKDVYDEARWIANEIKNLTKKGASYKDIAILYRAHYVSRAVEEVFVKNEIPYILYSGVGFYQRKEIKDILSYLRMIVYEDDLSFLRIINEPKRGFGQKRMEIIKQFAEQNNCSLYESLKLNSSNKLIVKSKANEFIEIIEKYKKLYKNIKITDLLSSLLSDTGYEAMIRESGEDERLNNLAELKNSISDYEQNAMEETSLEEYLQEISLFTNEDVKENIDNVNMMTLHTAKGLEFPYVFICGLNEGVFPSAKTKTRTEMEEERRLAYVGYTRAKNRLFLSDAEGVNHDHSYRYPSRFIFNTDKNYLDYKVELKSELVEESNIFIDESEKSLYEIPEYFKVGDIVTHKYFGIGKILKIDKKSSVYDIKFQNIKTPRSVSALSKELKKISTLESTSKNEDMLINNNLKIDEQDKIEREKLKAKREEDDKKERQKLKELIETEYIEKIEELKLRLLNKEKEINVLINKLEEEYKVKKDELEEQFLREKENLKLKLEKEDKVEREKLKAKREEDDKRERQKLKKSR